MELPKRKPARLQDYDYSAPGAYFVTICTKDRKSILSEITVGDGVLDVPHVTLSAYGRIVEETLEELVRTYDWLTLDRNVIMPNHIHLLLRIEETGASGTPPPTAQNGTPTPANAKLPMLISTLKRFSNRKCGVQLWQRSYHEHVIRNESDFREVWGYMDNNPARWNEDRYHEQ